MPPPLLPAASQGALLASCTSWPSAHCLHHANTAACSPRESFYNSSVKWLNAEVSEKRAGRRMPEDTSEGDITGHLEE